MYYEVSKVPLILAAVVTWAAEEALRSSTDNVTMRVG